MDAIILVAGLGIRLRLPTLTTPNLLLPVRGRPILDWTLGVLLAVLDRVLVAVKCNGRQMDLRSQNYFAAQNGTEKAQGHQKCEQAHNIRPF